MTQMNIFAEGNRYSKLSRPGDNPGKLNAVIDWEMFRPAIETTLKKEHKSKEADVRMTLYCSSRY